MFIRDEFGNLTFVPTGLCSVEAEGAAEGAGGAAEGGQEEGEGASGGAGKQAEGSQEGKDEGTAAEGDWRSTLQSDEARAFAKTSPDVAHLVDRGVAMHKKLSTAIVPPGKDAQPEEVAAYHKRIGVPETAEGYSFQVLEGHEPTEADLGFQTHMAKALHEAEIPAEKAALLNAALNEFTEQALEAQVVADKKFADKSVAELRKAWPGDEYDANKAHAERAAAWMFGDQFEAMRHMETKDGHFIFDHPAMLRAMATAGREMAEGGLVPPMSDGDREQAEGALSDLRGRIAAAQSEGNTKEATDSTRRSRSRSRICAATPRSWAPVLAPLDNGGKTI